MRLSYTGSVTFEDTVREMERKLASLVGNGGGVVLVSNGLHYNGQQPGLEKSGVEQHKGLTLEAYEEHTRLLLVPLQRYASSCAACHSVFMTAVSQVPSFVA